MSRFDYFIVFAEMRTGSNFLETNLNAFDHLSCLGEAFNPHFIGYPNRDDCLGISQETRDADPAQLIDAVKAAPGLAGFRFFHDHDPRVLDIALPDPRCAKIVLTRNPAESYVSWKIAQQTGQWKLTDVRRRKETTVTFDPAEFEAQMSALQAFQITVLNALQTTGQTAFYLAYEDLQDVAVINGLGAFLGAEQRLTELDRSLKPQNPQALADKVANFPEMEQALARLDRFNLNRTPNFEPRRGAQVPSYVAGARTPLMYLPLRGGPEAEVRRWLAGLDDVAPGDLPAKFNQKTLRQWKRQNVGHRSFTILRHPVARAHHVFCRRILSRDKGSFGEIRRVLRKRFKLPIPGEGGGTPEYTLAQHRTAFLAFLDFLKANLAGQTAVRIDANWATQASALEGFGSFALPDLILREDEMTAWLPALAQQLGVPDPAEPEMAPEDTPHALARIYDAEVEARAAEVYQRDYMMFGFGPWR
ncbi:sulfotransferase domain-containing protein [Pseudooceanicola aestuarii]|uniref:sulfotransferase domain-containing protein n=1 Tax=Pseudooceanicola aestuarii TaxID=2697319 RepID=UPI0013D742C1|nr:sulfotransferase domain-containing protein [Pseudooceanicola aestuarii]